MKETESSYVVCAVISEKFKDVIYTIQNLFKIQSDDEIIMYNELKRIEGD
jgi:hypothetical protein